MLHSVKDIQSFRIAASDGDIGEVEQIYFDDHSWVIRYLVIRTGGWLARRKVLISPRSVVGIDWEQEAVRVNLSRQQVQDSPDIDADRPVSRQNEAELHDYYGHSYYWNGPYLWGANLFPGIDNPMVDPGMPGVQEHLEQVRQHTDPHLRSSKEVSGYHIQTSNDTLGHVEDFLFDDRSWAILLLVIETRDWWPGKHVLLAPQRIDDVDWARRTVVVNITREELEHSPDYDMMSAMPDGVVQQLYRRFLRPPHTP